MDVGAWVEAVRSDLEVVTPPDDASREITERVLRAIEPSLQLRLLDAAGQLAVDLSEQVPSGHVEVRLAGRDCRLVFVAEEGPPAPDDEETARLTLRLPEGLKARIEAAAAAETLSTNAWLVRAVARSVEQRPRHRAGSRITGFARG